MLNPHAPSFEYGGSSNNNGRWVGYPYAIPSYPHLSSVYVSSFVPYPVAHNWITSYVDHHPAPPPPPPFPLPPQRTLELEEFGSQDEGSKDRDSRVVKARQRPAYVFSARKEATRYQVAEATRWVPKDVSRLPNVPFVSPEREVANGGDVGRACSPRKHTKDTRSRRSGAFMVDDENHHKKERYRTTVMVKNIPNRLKYFRFCRLIFLILFISVLLVSLRINLFN